MPTWVAPVIALCTAIFSAGVTWGILSFRQRKSEQSQTDIVKDLRECVSKLQNVVTEVEVVKASTARTERITEDHDKRIGALEVAIAKLGRSPRKR